MSETPAPNQDAEHLKLLSIFHYVCAGMIALFSCFPILHLIFGLLMLFAPEMFGEGNQKPPQILGLIFVVFSTGMILVGWTLAAFIAWTGRCLSQRRRYLFCLVMAGIDCTLVPGTVLGTFTIIVLARPTVKALFRHPSPV